MNHRFARPAAITCMVAGIAFPLTACESTSGTVTSRWTTPTSHGIRTYYLRIKGNRDGESGTIIVDALTWGSCGRGATFPTCRH